MFSQSMVGGDEWFGTCRVRGGVESLIQALERKGPEESEFNVEDGVERRKKANESDNNETGHINRQQQ